MLVVFGIFLYVSHHSLAGIVEVHEGAESVQLPYQYSGDIPEVNPSVLWTRNDLNPKIIHRQREEGADPSDQNQLYRKRTSMNPDFLDTGNFRLTLRKPQLSDSGNYTCTISDGRVELKLAQVQLEVKDSLTEVKVKEKAESVILPCRTKAVLNKETLGPARKNLTTTHSPTNPNPRPGSRVGYQILVLPTVGTSGDQ
ncbi:PREDICTED: V-set domain containing T-cell activation inhibitor 1-like [Cyprinodon variegatus]|uniref:V-set domain containing T-cell activation inhibitor 1-like n=1 Tax=Cyprinodon variegatus TaxID=28743 RepID=UPI00074271D7|nr:PREDICTED: V-set domain containing T-cell activation inhibitor 1-like [Cyprinodon variegatus]